MTRADMATLTSLDVTDGQIETGSLEGIEHAANLRTLSVGGTAVEDLAPLADLNGLEVLYAWKWGSDARIVDVSPLADLTSLEILDLSRNGVKDVVALAGLTNLTYLSLNVNVNVNEIVDVTPLAGSTELEYLSLRWNRVGDISALAPELVGNVGVVLLPSELGGQAAGTLGGWNFGITTDADERTAAAELMAFLASEQEQLERATQHAYLPALTSLYDDAAVQAVLPTFDVRTALTRAVARPSDDVGAGDYDAVSELVYGYVHDVLEGDASAADALAAAQATIEAETGHPGGTPW